MTFDYEMSQITLDLALNFEFCKYELWLRMGLQKPRPQSRKQLQILSYFFLSTTALTSLTAILPPGTIVPNASAVISNRRSRDTRLLIWSLHVLPPTCISPVSGSNSITARLFFAAHSYSKA